MRYRMERFVLLPFSVGCISESSVAIGHHHQKSSSTHQPNLTPTRSQEEEKGEEEDHDEKSLDGENLKSPVGLPKFQRLFKNFKNLSQLFVDREEMEEEEEEMGMEIGLPTNVKHVTHIGIDGDEATNTSLILNSTRTNWDYLNLKSPNNHHHDLLTQFSSNFPFPNYSPNHTSIPTSS